MIYNSFQVALPNAALIIPVRLTPSVIRVGMREDLLGCFIAQFSHYNAS